MHDFSQKRTSNAFAICFSIHNRQSYDRIQFYYEDVSRALSQHTELFPAVRWQNICEQLANRVEIVIVLYPGWWFSSRCWWDVRAIWLTNVKWARLKPLNWPGRFISNMWNVLLWLERMLKRYSPSSCGLEDCTLRLRLKQLRDKKNEETAVRDQHQNLTVSYSDYSEANRAPQRACESRWNRTRHRRLFCGATTQGNIQVSNSKTVWSRFKEPLIVSHHPRAGGASLNGLILRHQFSSLLINLNSG